ncbi:MAG: signal peptide peptidase SppA [Pseudomonadota bacterium]
MFKFIRGLFRTIYLALKVSAVVVFGTLALFMIVALLSASTQESEGLFIGQGTVLEVAIEGFVVEERQAVSPVAFLGVAGQIEPEARLHDITRALKKATDDDRITGVALKLDRMFGASPAALTEIGLALEAVKASGKPIVAHGDFYTQSQYYLASFADEIWLNPAGFVNLSGYGIYPLYLKEALDKYGVTVNAFRAGEFKSFVEPYTRSDMSPEAREANDAFLSSLWSTYLTEVGENLPDSAGLSAYVNAPLDGLKAVDGDGAQWAVKAGLVTKLMARNEMRDALKARFAEGEDFKTIGYQLYLTDLPSPLSSDKDNVAVLYASGQILDGEQPPGTVGGDTLAERIRNATNTKSIKAIVLRIDSPGGSAFASEIIRQELIAAKAAGKTIVASVGSYAASGGYWIATAADKIIAHPTSITGSIGVFVVVPSFEKTLEDFGVKSDGVSTAPLADAFSLTRGISPLGQDILQIQVDDAYNQFLALVADARQMSVDAVDDIAQGRVWTGAQALERGLIDSYGTLDDAIETAAELAGLEDYNRIMLKDPPTPFEQILERLRPYLGTAAKAPRGKPKSSVQALLETMKATLMTLEVGDIEARCLECLALVQGRR